MTKNFPYSARQTAVSTHSVKAVSLILLFGSLLITAVLFLMQTQPVEAAVNCADSAWSVGDEADLNDAITCFNAKPAGSYTISLTQPISLTASSTAIDNATVGVALLLDGGGFTVDGQGTVDVRPFEIFTDTTATMQNINIINGNVTSNGGGIHNSGTLTVSNSTLSGNSADSTNFSGGGIYNSGTLTVSSSTLSSNSSETGGGIANDGGTLTVTDSTLNNNSSEVGSGISNDSSTLTITNSTFSSNSAFAGGGIFNSIGTFTVSNSTFSGNSAETGGGIYTVMGALTMSNSTLSGNSASSIGGGIFNDSGTLIISNNALSGNSAVEGGGIYSFSGILTVTNSTLSSNSASPGNGGGIFNDAGTTTVTNDTFSGNSANNGGGIHNFSGSTTVSNSIVANSSSGGDCSGTITSGGYNLDSDSSCSWTEPSDISNSDPLLGSLQDNGGATFTHALLLGSPAIDAGDTTLAADQRGIARPQGLADDIGAFEKIPYDCAVQPWLVSDKTNLDDAISCYNAQTVANGYIISVTQNISLTASSIAINNSTAGVSLLLDGGGFVVDGQDVEGVRPFEIDTNTTVTLQNITITGGNVTGHGGGVTNNGTLTVANSTLSDNSASGFGGGIYNSATLTVTSSTVNGNAAINFGGGMANFDTLTVANSTVSGNSDGIYNGDTLALSSSTLSGNSGGGVANDGSTAVISNSIIANSGFMDCSGSVALTSTGHNLDSDGSCSWTEPSDISNSDPLLGSLQDNGGSTFTHALLDNSPAIDAGETSLTIDQRGVVRPQRNADDIGAFEREGYEIFLPLIVNP